MAELSVERVLARLNALLKDVDPETTTTKDIFRILTESLGDGVKQHKKEIRIAISEYFEGVEDDSKTREAPTVSEVVYSMKLEAGSELRVLQESGKRHVAICAAGESDSKIAILSEEGFSRLVEGVKELQEAQSNDETVTIELNSEEKLSLKREGGRAVLEVWSSAERAVERACVRMEIAALEKIAGNHEDVVACLRDSSAKTDSGKRTKRRGTADPADRPSKAQKASVPGEYAYSVELGTKVFLTVSEFKGKMRADLRRYYNDKATGELRPTQKGLSMDKAQFTTLIENAPRLKAAVAEKDTSFAVELGSRRRVSVSDFTGRCMIDLREYYLPKGGSDWKPAKKGISIDAAVLESLSAEADPIMAAMK